MSERGRTDVYFQEKLTPKTPSEATVTVMDVHLFQGVTFILHPY